MTSKSFTYSILPTYMSATTLIPLSSSLSKIARPAMSPIN